jgi:hypothetical protein
MNNAGKIVTTGLGTAGAEVWAGDGGPMTLVRSTSFDGSLNGGAAINDAGTVAIYDRNGSLTSESLGYVSGGTFVPIASTATGYSTITRPSINNAGAIAFAAFHAGDHLYRYANGILGDVTPQGFGHSGDVAINGVGDIVYHQIVAGADRIRVGTNTVITRGDPLFGSTVSILQLGSDSINDAGQVVFQANLADGRSVAVLAQVPEPALALLVPAIMLLRNRRPRRLNA